MNNTVEKLVQPLVRGTVQTAEHAYRRFNAIVPGHLEVEDLLKSRLWEHAAHDFQIGSEIRCVADDGRYVANLYVAFVRGSSTRLKLLSFTPMDDVDYDAMSEEDDYFVKFRGPRRWSIIKRSDGSVIKENMATQPEALRELADFQKIITS